MSGVSPDIIYEESPDRLKVTIPVRINWLLLGIYTSAGIVWLAMLLVVIAFLARGLSSNLVLTILLLFWMLIWLWFGRVLWKRWLYQAANREILFIDDVQLTIRRPVSLLGQTTSYDLSHIAPFYYSGKHTCLAFDYAYLHVYFGHSLDQRRAQDLIEILNARYFPDLEEQ